ncbi:MAG: GNAT family N-acetyltransferase [Oscillospiraceae bacterium]|jgi:RimJ/RimL family protein N-acetyltransferase|nr:GNAT family N-acetyltransferase [Oscillospiraceae bacterium]
MRYFKKIAGGQVYLSPINADDAETYAKWLNNKETTHFLNIYSHALPLAAERDALEKISREHNYAIVRASDDILLGNIGFHGIKHINRTAIIGIFIGEPSQWGKGYGTEAMKLLIEYGFDTLNLRNIMLLHFADNDRARRCYEKVGFREIGRRTGAVYRDGAYIDEVFMEILNPRG